MSERGAIQKILVGTRNPHKLNEIRRILTQLPVELCGLDQVPSAPPVVEDGVTFEQNAIKKAREVADATGYWVLADDSGLEVHALAGRPGVWSARYAGPAATDVSNNAKLLAELDGVAERAATFRCVIALAKPGELLLVARGDCEGVITREPRGPGGFGYDPVFLVPELEKTFAEIGPEHKNRISHRSRALDELRQGLGELLEGS